jgi:hypothetical protein
MSTGRLGAGDTAIQPTIFDAKADILTATAADTPARLAVGSNDTVLTADSSTATGLKWAAAASVPESLGFTAGKNKIINGDFYINQRGFSSSTTAGAYGFDRWYLSDNTTMTYSSQNFTTGTAPVAGYEGKSFMRGDVTTSSSSGEYAIIIQPIEDVRTFAGQTVTVSLWAKASSGTPKLGIELYQSFGSGGSAGVTSNGQSVTISTSWTRYSVTISVPSISGKTIGTSSSLDLNLWFSAGSNLATRSGSVGNQTAVIDVWGVQVEAGSVATAFQTATGTLAGELDACMRYYQEIQFGPGSAADGSNIDFMLPHTTTMRVAPSATVTAALRATDFVVTDYNASVANISIIGNSTTGGRYRGGNFSGLTNHRFYGLINGGGTIKLSAEL